MSNFQFHQTQFIKSATKPTQYPQLKSDSGELLPEIAVIGRSNVGKSSLLNHLFKRKNLAKTSSTPGKTQLINFFQVDEKMVFADLPGYGFAKVPVAKKQEWGPMVEDYFEARHQVRALLFLFDIRRIPKEEDQQFLMWFLNRGISVVLVLTKVDKVKTHQRNANTEKILEGLQALDIEYVYYSTLKNIGRNQLISALKGTLCEKSDQ